MSFAPASLLIVLLTGCETTPPTPPVVAELPVVADPPPSNGPASPTPSASARVLAPSPLSLEAAVREAGVAGELADLVPTVPADTQVADPDRVALRTGVIIAYALLGGREQPKEVFVAQIRAARDGMASIGAGEGLLSTVDDNIRHVENDAASRDDFLREMDAILSYASPQDGWGPQDRTGPLVQAGAWLAGTNVVARAIVRSGKPEAANALLRRADVAEYFLRYTQSEGKEKAGPISEQLEASLKQMVEISNKSTLELQDAQVVADATDAILKLL